MEGSSENENPKMKKLNKKNNFTSETKIEEKLKFANKVWENPKNE
jgi:hypothetical protein